MVQLSHPYRTTGKTMALTVWTFVGNVMSLLFNMVFPVIYPKSNGQGTLEPGFKPQSA